MRDDIWSLDKPYPTSILTERWARRQICHAKGCAVQPHYHHVFKDDRESQVRDVRTKGTQGTYHHHLSYTDTRVCSFILPSLTFAVNNLTECRYRLRGKKKLINRPDRTKRHYITALHGNYLMHTKVYVYDSLCCRFIT